MARQERNGQPVEQTDNTDDGRDARRVAATNKGPARAATRDARGREN